MGFGSIRICSPFGIPIKLHYSFWLIVVLFLVILANTSYPSFYANFAPRALRYDLGRDLTEAERWSMSFLTIVLFFGSLLAHELGHAVVAKRLGIPVHSVELFVFGGVARMMAFTRRPRDEFLLASSGPVVSLGLALLMGGAFFLLKYPLHVKSPVADVAGFAALFNLATLGFNLVPAYPLDGGRVVQGVLWRVTRRRTLAAAVPAGFGMALAVLLVAWGAIEIAEGQRSGSGEELRRQLMAGTWPILIGVFIALAAYKSFKGVRMLERVSAMTATHALDGRVQSLQAETDLLSGRLIAFPKPDIPVAAVVNGEGRATAVLVNDGAEGNPRPATVGEAAQPAPAQVRVVETTSLLDTLMTMARAQSAWLIVEDAQGRYVGTLTKSSLRAAFGKNNNSREKRPQE